MNESERNKAYSEENRDHLKRPEDNKTKAMHDLIVPPLPQTPAPLLKP